MHGSTGFFEDLLSNSFEEWTGLNFLRGLIRSELDGPKTCKLSVETANFEGGVVLSGLSSFLHLPDCAVGVS